MCIFERDIYETYTFEVNLKELLRKKFINICYWIKRVKGGRYVRRVRNLQ
jgi:hypothetical protein